ncbi:hypothetical protein C9417_17705 [Rhizobium sp. SEMIA 4088]|uniref:Uncharacterized protein n=1 Tax=Rhizobium tropici TaxID=398 RepID=A0A6P1C321_RHITR|nr:hypothetical protein [Rhizobium tropici]TGE96160.1 hypothetical protein C9417_17705 [Rhizobium sp. SEMIA 4088]
MLQSEPASTLANWQELRTPTDVVQSVAGRQGAVTLTSADLTDASTVGRALFTAANATAQVAALGLGNVNNTSDAAKPISNATQAALNQKSDTGHKHVIADIANLQTTLDTKQAALGYAPANKAGDMFTGDVELASPASNADIGLWLHRRNVKRGRWVVDANGSLCWQDQGGQIHFYISSAGAIGTQQLGDLNTRIEDRSYYWGQAHVNNAVTNSQMAGYVEVLMANGSVINNGGYVLTMAQRVDRDQYRFGSRQPQLYIQNRGWFAAFPF